MTEAGDGQLVLERMRQLLPALVEGVTSLEELMSLLTGQVEVTSVVLRSYLLKSYPPQRELYLTLQVDPGCEVNAVLNIYEEPDGTYRFARLREA